MTHSPKDMSALVEGLRTMVGEFEDFINEPPQYEDQRMVRDYRHEAYRKWEPLCRATLSLLAEITALQAKMEKLEGQQRVSIVDQDGNEVGERFASIRELATEEAFKDEAGTVWTVPTAWAYFAACRALNAAKAKVEEARGVIEGLNAHVERMQQIVVGYLVPEPYMATNGMMASAKDDQTMRDKLFISDMIYMLDGPEQREAQWPARNSGEGR